MKKLIIGGLVAGLILFLWQYVSWSFTGIHSAEMEYSENQDEIMAALEGKLADGTYYMPNMTPGMSSEEMQAHWESRIGKPWAVISYHNAMESNMAMNMFRGFLIDFLAAVLLCWVMMKFQSVDMMTAIKTSLAVGLIGYLTISYLNSIWFQGNSMGQLIDTVVEWTLVGAWLGYYLKK